LNWLEDEKVIADFNEIFQSFFFSLLFAFILTLSHTHNIFVPDTVKHTNISCYFGMTLCYKHTHDEINNKHSTLPLTVADQ